MQIQLEISPETKRTLAELGELGRSIPYNLSLGLGKAVKLAASNVSSKYLTGQALKRRSGNLARAVEGWLDRPLEGAVGIREDAAVNKYAWLLTDEQKEIFPVRAKFLTIPVGEGLTGAGVARFSSPRDVPEGFFLKTKTGNLLFGYKNGKRGKFRPLFVLVKSVFVQGSGALADGVLESVDEMTGVIQEEVNKRIGA